MFSFDRQNSNNSSDNPTLDDLKHSLQNLGDLWARAGALLRAELGEDVYSSWFIRIELQNIVNDTAHLTVSTRFLKSWIETHYTKNILAALNHELAQDNSGREILHISFSVRPGVKTIIARENFAKDPMRDQIRGEGNHALTQTGQRASTPTTLIHLQGKFATTHIAGAMTPPANQTGVLQRQKDNGQNSYAHHSANSFPDNAQNNSSNNSPNNSLGMLSAKIQQRAGNKETAAQTNKPLWVNGTVKEPAHLAQSKTASSSQDRTSQDRTSQDRTSQDRTNQASSLRNARVDIEALNGSPLDRRMTFSNFVVGRHNAIAFAAAKRVVESVGTSSSLYNPLFIHANVGLGKTHLLQAIAHDVGARGKRVTYLTAEKFMYSFVSSLKSQTAIAFKDKLRTIDMLIIDDIQFLQGKVIQMEFCHTLNALIDVGRQIVIASDRPPQDLEQLEERVRSRLGGGLSIEMGPLEETMRLEILSARIAQSQLIHPDFFVPQDVLTFVARNIATNGRDLDGAVNRLIAHATLTASPLTIETAEIAVRDLVRASEPKRIKIEDIQRVVSSHYQVNREDMLSARRTSVVVRPRQVAMYLSKVLTPRSLPEIGRRFGNRDHTTVLHAVRKIDEMIKTDSGLQEEINLLKRILQE